MNPTLDPAGNEVPDNEAIAISEKTPLNYNGKDYTIVVKSSRKALFDLAGTKIYSLVQILNSKGREVFHEVFPSVLNETQATTIKDNITKNTKDYIVE